MKVFGRRPARTFSHAPRPASENLQGTKPREGARIGRCRALSYGDLAVGGPQLRSAARLARRDATALQHRCAAAGPFHWRKSQGASGGPPCPLDAAHASTVTEKLYPPGQRPDVRHGSSEGLSWHQRRQGSVVKMTNLRRRKCAAQQPSKCRVLRGRGVTFDHTQSLGCSSPHSQ